MTRTGRSRRGMALIAVILVLVALAVIATPFALSMRNQDRAAALLSYNNRAVEGVRSTARVAAAQLAMSDPAFDPTPHWDGPDELAVRLDLKAYSTNVNDPTGSIWSARADDAQGRIHVNHCSPFLLGNRLGAGFVTSPVEADEVNELRMSSGDGLPEQGIVWVNGELITYKAKNGSTLSGLTRGFDTTVIKSRIPVAHGMGSPVIPYRVILATVYPWKSVQDGFSGFANVLAMKDIARFGEDVFKTTELESVENDLTTFAALPGGGPFVGAARSMFAFGPNDEIPEVYVNGGRNLGPGTVVHIRDTKDPKKQEWNLVVEAQESGNDQVHLILQEPVRHDYEADEAILSGLARAPVNVNTCSREVLIALLDGLRLSSSEARLDSMKAESVADAIIKARPVAAEQGLDLLLKEMETSGALTPQDRQAIVLNALNAADTSLAFSTAPFAYRSYGVFEVQSAVSENYRAGREATRLFARDVLEARPAGAQTTLFSSQMDFDESMRLSRSGKFWWTFPHNTLGFDRFNQPPLPLIPYTVRGRYALREDEESEDAPFARLAPVRIENKRDATALAGDRAVHFDEFVGPRAQYDADHADGWRVDKLGPVSLPVDGELVNLLNDRDWVAPFELELYWTPGEGAGGAETYLFDTGESEISNRIFAYVAGGVLYFRVADATVPDLPDLGTGTTGGAPAAESPTQMAELRLDFAEEGLPLEEEVPYHLKFYARGTKPSDMALFVDGVPRGRRAFQTRLKQNLDAPATPGPLSTIQGYTPGQNVTIKVEDARAFPSYGVIRIGRELLEYTSRTDDTFMISSTSTGAGFGGRLRRDSRAEKHYESEAVELYGYAAVLHSKIIPKGDQPLASEMGPLGIAMVDPKSNAVKKPINLQLENVPTGAPPSIQIGEGMDETVTEIPLVGVIKPKPNGGGAAGSLEGMFQKQGGFALIVSAAGPPPSNGGNSQIQLGPGIEIDIGYSRAGKTPKGAIIGLGEVIRYASFDGTRLTGVQRAPAALNGTKWSPQSNLKATGTASEVDQMATAPRVHVYRWMLMPPSASSHDPYQPIFVLPISVGAGGNVDLAKDDKFAVPELLDSNTGNKPMIPGGNQGALSVGTRPELVQIGLSGAGTGKTEWVRYDTIGDGYFVRDNPIRLRRVIEILGRYMTEKYTAKSGNVPKAEDLAKALNYEEIGATQNDKADLATAAGMPATLLDGGVLAFRGVLGTTAQKHAQNERMIPVFRTHRRNEIYTGRPGARDFVTAIDPKTGAREQHRVNWAYCDDDAEGWFGSACHVAFEEGTAADFESNFWQMFSEVDPSNPSAAVNALANLNIESRDVTRLLKFPSGELPTQVGEEMFFGADFQGSPSPAPMTIDELEFFTPQTPAQELPRHPRFIMSRDDGLEKNKLYLERDELRYNLWSRGGAAVEAIDPTSNLPQDGFVILVDDELIAIRQIDMINDEEAELTVAENGRGYLGTPIQYHPEGCSVRELTFLRVSRLDRNMNDKDERIEIADTIDFPMRGTVLIGKELLGYSRVEGNRLLMPSWRDPDTKAESGLLRGRFGTTPGSHQQDGLVYLFPTRYEDRWHPRSDDPELGYVGLRVQGRGAFFREVTWETTGGSKLADVVVQARVGGRGSFTDDPTQSKDVFLFDRPATQDARNLLLRQGDELELRVFTRFLEGAFDASVLDPDPPRLRGGTNDWKKAPRLMAVGVEWIAGPAGILHEEWR